LRRAVQEGYVNRILSVDDEPHLLVRAGLRTMSGCRERSDLATLACSASKAERRDRAS